MVDYSKLIDGQTWGFIREAESYYPLDTINLSVAGQRQVYDKLCRGFYNGRPEGVEARDRVANGVPVRCYRMADGPVKAVVLYCHGGGYVVGSLDSHDDVCAEICGRTGFAVVSVDYRLAPEHLHPAAYEDCLTAYHWAVHEYDLPVVLAGDSAGGNLAAAVGHAMRDALGMVLIYPTLGEYKDCGSYVDHANAPLLTRADMDFYEEIRTPKTGVVKDFTYAPLLDRDFSGLPPIVAVSAECDPLCDDGKDYCTAVQNAGGQAIWVKETGLVHGYLRARHTVDRARNSFSRVVAAIDAFGHRRSISYEELMRISD